MERDDLRLRELADAVPFVLLVDERLRVVWASDAVRRRTEDVVARPIGEVVRLQRPPGDLTRPSLIERTGKPCRLALLSHDGSLPLAGFWIPCGEGFAMLASPRPEDLDSLSVFTFDDFGEDDPVLGLLVSRDEMKANFADATRAVQSLKWHNAELARSREELRAADDLQRQLLATAATAIFLVDTDRRIRDVNDEFCAATGYRRNEVIGKSCDVLAGDRCTDRCALFDAAVEKPILRTPCMIRSKDGRRLTIMKNADLIRSDGGAITGGMESFVDVTPLMEAREVAEAASRAKSDFLANMSHEIRTPMNGIIGMTELALETDLSPRQREFLETVRVSAESLLGILNEILDFSRIQAGRLDLETIDFHLGTVVGETLRTVAPAAHAKGLELVGWIHPDVPEGVRGDPHRLRQILLNLLGNATKFTEQGEIVLGVEPGERIGRSIELHVTVRDTGIGIPPEKREAIFEAFLQADSSTTRMYGGTGLGLTVSSRLIEMMGGRIWVESEPGEGSTFHFTVRLERAKRAVRSTAPADTKRLRGLPVLVVDDNSTSRRILAEMLTCWKARPILASGGEDALAALREAGSAGEPFPVVLLDALMPGIDGYELARRIAADPQLAETKVLMLTSAGRLDSGGGAPSGIHASLMKPVRQAELLRAILSLLDPNGVDPSRPSDTVHRIKGPSFRPLRILLAEDNRTNQRLIVRMLERRGHSVLVAADGREALAALDGGSFDAVLMDVQMPMMDGLEATAVHRERERSSGAHIPIIALTAHGRKGDEQRCLEVGMDAFLSKPIKPLELDASLDCLTSTEPSRPGSSR